MKGLVLSVAGLLLAASFSPAAPGKDSARTYMGSIGDSMCGAKHMMPGESAKDCTLGCIKRGIEIYPHRSQRKNLSIERPENS
jgi:hypothetical protein